MSFLIDDCVQPHDAKRVEKEHQMKHFKDLDACIALLRALQARNDIGPEQKKDVGEAIEEAKRLRRKRGATHVENYRCVRRIAERLVNAFLKR